MAADVVHRLGIVDADCGLQRQQPSISTSAGRLADVVGAGLEGQPPNGDGLIGKLAGEVLFDLPHQHDF